MDTYRSTQRLPIPSSSGTYCKFRSERGRNFRLDDLADLGKVDWDMVYQQYWADSSEDMDRQRRKQAEFLVHRFCRWDWIEEIGVLNGAARGRVEAALTAFQAGPARPVLVRPGWYYP